MPLGEFTVTIPGPHASASAGRVRSPGEINVMITLKGVRISSAILKIVFRHILLFFVFNAV